MGQMWPARITQDGTVPENWKEPPAPPGFLRAEDFPCRQAGMLWSSAAVYGMEKVRLETFSDFSWVWIP